MKQAFNWNLKQFYLNNDEIVGLLVILIALWFLFYLLPQIFVSLFNTLLGNFIVILSLLLLYSSNRIYGVIAAVVAILLYRMLQLRREPFTPQSQLQFLKIQNTINKNKIFDMNVIDTQASQEELDYFNEHGMWPWSPEVIELYEEAVRRNPYIRTIDKLATMDARKVYNQAAIIRILTYQSKEGQFMLKGIEIPDQEKDEGLLASGFGTFGKGLLSTNHNDIIRCNLETNQMERTNHSGSIQVQYTNLEKEIPGFTFLQEPCNPCGSMAAIPDYSCKYRLYKDQPPSSIWQYLWS